VNPALFRAQRATAVVLAVAVAVHLATILYAAQHGITAGAILGRTRGSLAFLALYAAFVLAASIHGPTGLRTILREWAGWHGRGVDAALVGFAVILAVLGLRAAWGLYA